MTGIYLRPRLISAWLGVRFDAVFPIQLGGDCGRPIRAGNANGRATGGEDFVRREHYEVLTFGLRDQHADKRIAVVPLQHCHSWSVFGP